MLPAGVRSNSSRSAAAISVWRSAVPFAVVTRKLTDSGSPMARPVAPGTGGPAPGHYLLGEEVHMVNSARGLLGWGEGSGRRVCG